MGKTYEELDQKLIDWIGRQKMFFVATAPLSGDGLVNLSPKGYDAFRVIDEKTVAYADLGGSGIETVAHVRENQRITIMFCAFEGPAMILRLYGRGRIMQFDHPDFEQEIARFENFGRARNIVFIDVERIADSCGWGVPFYNFKSERDQLTRYIEHRELEDWRESRMQKNAESLDGLPGMVRAAKPAE